MAVLLNVSAFGFLNLCPARPKLPELCGDATSRPLSLTRPAPVIVRTLEKQFSQLSRATLESNALPALCPPRLGRPVLEDSKLGMLGTEGKGELVPPPPPAPPAPPSGLKLFANSALDGRTGWDPMTGPVLSQAGTSQGQSQRRVASSKARPNGHLKKYLKCEVVMMVV